jgi:hypothetical protein
VAAAAPAGNIVAMSCLGAKSCIGIGNYASPVSGESAFLRTWNGTAWSQTAPPSPASSLHVSELLAVSCANARSCVAVGQYDVATTNPEVQGGYLPEGFIDVWNGTKWAASYKTTTGKPGGLDGVSCWSVSRCVAVGNYFARPKGAPVTGKSTLIAARWNGSRWSVAKLPTPGYDAFLNGVSCVSASSCLAVGGVPSESEGNVYLARADAWNGKTWRAIAVATPKGGAGKTGDFPNSFDLTNLTCATAKDCVAFGFVGPLGRGPFTDFAELYAGTRLSNLADS